MKFEKRFRQGDKEREPAGCRRYKRREGTEALPYEERSPYEATCETNSGAKGERDGERYTSVADGNAHGCPGGNRDSGHLERAFDRSLRNGEADGHLGEISDGGCAGGAAYVPPRDALRVPSRRTLKSFLASGRAT